MKCPNCGSEEFYHDVLMPGTGSYPEPIRLFYSPVDAYICKHCGRVEFYCPGGLAQAKENERENREKQEKEAEAKTKINSLREEQKRLEAIVGDENQTVKSVKEAEKRLAEVKSEIAHWESRR